MTSCTSVAVKTLPPGVRSSFIWLMGLRLPFSEFFPLCKAIQRQTQMKHFRWGVPTRILQATKMRLAEPRARVMATRIERRWDYFATLSAHYQDQSILMRPIKGVFRQTSLENLRPVYPEKSTTPFTPRTASSPPPAFQNDPAAYRPSASGGNVHHPPMMIWWFVLVVLVKRKRSSNY